MCCCGNHTLIHWASCYFSLPHPAHNICQIPFIYTSVLSGLNAMCVRWGKENVPGPQRHLLRARDSTPYCPWPQCLIRCDTHAQASLQTCPILTCLPSSHPADPQTRGSSPQINWTCSNCRVCYALIFRGLVPLCLGPEWISVLQCSLPSPFFFFFK